MEIYIKTCTYQEDVCQRKKQYKENLVICDSDDSQPAEFRRKFCQQELFPKLQCPFDLNLSQVISWFSEIMPSPAQGCLSQILLKSCAHLNACGNGEGRLKEDGLGPPVNSRDRKKEHLEMFLLKIVFPKPEKNQTFRNIVYIRKILFLKQFVHKLHIT